MNRSLCWDNAVSEVIELGSSDDCIEAGSSAESEEESLKKVFKNSVCASRSNEKCFITPRKPKFRIDSESSESDDCIVCSSEDEGPSQSSSVKVKQLSLPKFSFDIPDKRTVQKNRKLFTDISNRCNTPLQHKPSNSSRRVLGGSKPRKNKGTRQNNHSGKVVDSGQSKNDMIFNSLLGIDVTVKTTDKENQPKLNGIKTNSTYDDIVQSFMNILPAEVHKKECDVYDDINSDNSSIGGLKANEMNGKFFKKPLTTYKKQREIGNKMKRPGDSKIVSRRTDDSDSSCTSDHAGGDCQTSVGPSQTDLVDTTSKLKIQETQVFNYADDVPVLTISDTDDCIYDSGTPKPPIKKKGKTSVFSLEDLKTALDDINSHTSTKPGGIKQLSFLSSLDDVDDKSTCHPTATYYKEKFNKKKEELAAILFKMFNEQVFESRLESDMALDWSGRMTSSAGITHLSRKILNSEWKFLARITLSKPIVTTAARLRDTLIHEMCHAAVWQLDHKKDGHGSLWKAWTHRAREVFPELRSINTCHSYSRDWKFIWECVSCEYTIGRMTKSFNTERFSCGRCHGKFVLKETKQRKKTEVNHFAKFVKENYAAVKSKHGATHKEVMKALGEQYKNEKVVKGQVELD